MLLCCETGQPSNYQINWKILKKYITNSCYVQAKIKMEKCIALGSLEMYEALFQGALELLKVKVKGSKKELSS